MRRSSADDITELIASVRSSQKYAAIDEAMIRSIGLRELAARQLRLAGRPGRRGLDRRGRCSRYGPGLRDAPGPACIQALGGCSLQLAPVITSAG